MEPVELTLQRLQDITDDFSEGRKLGQGAYGTVYRGEDKNGREVAVKLLHNVGPGHQDEEFKNEFDNLRKLNHPHIMKLIGYCYETQHKHMEYGGKTIFAEKTYRALCLEYLHHGSLQNFLSEGISDGLLDWHTRFKIIKGAFEGLKYLHEEFKEPIYHLDLKPDNILLDMNMVPKLADFGLSKIFAGEHTWITFNCTGTVGYMPPEYIEKGIISKMFDIYSMGVVMLKTISGLSGRSKSAEMDPQEFINLVHNTWRIKLQEKWSGSSLEAYCQQVRRCAEIALNCVEVDRHHRPNIVDIVHELSELERAADEISSCPGGDLLSVYPFELVFPTCTESNAPRVACPIHLKNNTDDNIQYRLMIPHKKNEYTDSFSREYFIGQLSGNVRPRTMHTFFLAMAKELEAPPNYYKFFTIESWRRKDEVHQVKLVARYEPQGIEKSAHEILPDIFCRRFMDVHPTEPWIMVDSSDGVFMYNYETQETKYVETVARRSRGSFLQLQFQCCSPQHQDGFFLEGNAFTSAKFIARKKWIVVGDSSGSIYVYNYDPVEKIHQLKRAHSKSVGFLAIHPAEPYVLSASEDGYIKMWDFENQWKVMRVFGHIVFPWQDLDVEQRHVLFNPNDANIFVSIQDNRIKIWNIDHSECTFTSMYTTSAPDRRTKMRHRVGLRRSCYAYILGRAMGCMNYFSRGNELFLMGGFSNGNIKIWEFQSMECVKTLETPYGGICATCSHPDLPLLITGSEDGKVCLWNITTFKLEGTLSFGLGSVIAIECPKGSRRIVILHDKGLALTEIGPEQAGAGTE